MFDDVAITILLLLRLIAPFLIFKFQLIGILISKVLDMVDWQFFTTENPVGFDHYQNFDKYLDTYYLLFLIVIVLRWKDSLSKKVALLLFFWRAIGVILFLAGMEKNVLVFFPNLFEFFVIFYLVYHRFTRKEMLTSIGETLAVLGSLLIPKMAQELYLHWLTPSVPLGLEIVGGIVLFIPTFFVMRWLVTKNQSSNIE